MKYKFTYQTTAFDFWQLSMYYTYGSMVGVCNIVFTMAMFVLTAKFWGDVNGWLRICMIIACCLFTVIQPIEVYRRARKQVAKLPRDMEISFDERGIHIKAEKQISNLKWKSVKRVSKKPNMIVIFSTTTHGFILTNKVLGKSKEDFYKYVISKI